SRDDDDGDRAEARGDGETGGTEAADHGADPPSSSTASFVPDDVVGTPSCDAWAQDCPEDEKCAAWSSMGDTWDATRCVPILGTGRTGDECSYDGAAQGTDSCDLGHMCYY